MQLSIKNLTFGWNKTPLFQDVQCSLNKADVVQLVGENGAGKTTLLKLISGMIPHFERGQMLRGNIFIRNKSVFENAPKSFFPLIAFVPGKNIDFFLVTENLKDEILFTSSVLKLNQQKIDARLNDFFNIFPGFKNNLNLPFAHMDFSQKVLSLTFIYRLQNATLFLFDEVMNRFSISELHQWQDFLASLKHANKSVIYIDHQTTDKGYCQWSLSNGKLVTYYD